MSVVSVDGEMREERTDLYEGQFRVSHPMGHRKTGKRRVTRWHDQSEFYKEYSGVL